MGVGGTARRRSDWAFAAGQLTKVVKAVRGAVPFSQFKVLLRAVLSQ
jgi:hypothetical protein